MLPFYPTKGPALSALYPYKTVAAIQTMYKRPLYFPASFLRFLVKSICLGQYNFPARPSPRAIVQHSMAFIASRNVVLLYMGRLQSMLRRLYTL